MAPKAKAVGGPSAQGPPKKMRGQTTSAKGEVVTFLSRMQAGQYRKRCSEDERSEAAETLQQYNSLAQEEKASFALAYQGNKDAKTFQWARDFMQTVNVAKEDEEESTEKYMTRISCLIFFLVLMRLHVLLQPHVPCVMQHHNRSVTSEV